MNQVSLARERSCPGWLGGSRWLWPAAIGVLLPACLFAAIAADLASPAAAGTALDPAAEPPPAQRLSSDKASSTVGFVEIDALLRQGNWATASEQLKTQETRLTSNPNRRGEWLARLALAEAGSGQDDQALWDWGVANALATGLFNAEELRAFGPAGALLSGHPGRQPGEAPAGMSVEPPGPEVQREVKTRGEMPPLVRVIWEPHPWLRLEVIVDEQGRPRDPLVLSARSGEVAYRGLEAMRDWRFEPARKHGQPVATLHSLNVNPPGHLSLEKILSPSAETKAIENLLRRQLWRQAAERAEQRWYGLLDTAPPVGDQAVDRAALGMTMALWALARAGQDAPEQAWSRCRWEAAQSLLPSLYDLDVSPYGLAGEAVAAWRSEDFTAPFVRWFSSAPAETDKPAKRVRKPEKIASRAPHYPAAAKKRSMEGKVILESILDREGRVRHPALADPLDAGDPVTFAASALDALCDYRFRPATLEGKPVKVYYTLTVTFAVRRH